MNAKKAGGNPASSIRAKRNDQSKDQSLDLTFMTWRPLYMPVFRST